MTMTTATVAMVIVVTTIKEEDLFLSVVPAEDLMVKYTEVAIITEAAIAKVSNVLNIFLSLFIMLNFLLVSKCIDYSPNFLSGCACKQKQQNLKFPVYIYIYLK